LTPAQEGKALSERGGWPAIGYRVTVDPTEAELVSSVFTLVADRLSARELGRRLGLYEAK
jgi:hypothetical protein